MLLVITKVRDEQIFEYCNQIYNEPLSQSYLHFRKSTRVYKRKNETKVLEELIKYYENTTHHALAKSLKPDDDIFDEFEFDNNVEFNLNRVHKAFERKYANNK